MPMTDRGTRPTYTEEWRRECEARLVLSWSLARRRAYIAGVKAAAEGSPATEGSEP